MKAILFLTLLVSGLCEASPLIVDFGKTGIELSRPSLGVDFDIDADNATDIISWPTDAKSMFLALDLNGNQQIDDGTELFNFQSLARFDQNKDGMINENDEVFKLLLLWSDANGNGFTDKGELLTLVDKKIQNIDLISRKMKSRDKWGNYYMQRAKLTLTDGSIIPIYDVLFRKLKNKIQFASN